MFLANVMIKGCPMIALQLDRVSYPRRRTSRPAKSAKFQIQTQGRSLAPVASGWATPVGLADLESLAFVA